MFSRTSAHLPVAALALAGLALAQGALAQSPSTVSNAPFCRVSPISSSSAVNQDAYTNAWLDIGNYVCGDQADEPTVVNIDKQVEAVAFAIAEAFAEVSADCRASGSAEVRAQAYSIAQDRATAVGAAVTELFAAADVCGQCAAAVSALSELSRELVAEAVAEAWTDLYLFSDNGRSVSDISTVTSNAVVETVATVLGGISGTIRAGANDGCSIDVINEARLGDYLAQCQLSVSGDDRVVDIDPIADAGAEAAAYACNGVAESEVDVIARATARALAEAVEQADIFCESNGGPESPACGLAEVDVRAVASAQAEAFASAFFEARTCGCDVSGFVEVRVFDEIWAEAVANAYAETCGVGNGEVFVTDFQFAVEERILTATARAIAAAVDAASDAGAACRGYIIDRFCDYNRCVPRNRQCGGRGFAGVLPCCDPDDRCFVRTENDFRCRRRNSRIPSFWDGRIEECTPLGLAE